MAVQQAPYPVTYAQEMPERLSRWLWIFKWFLLIPHIIILWFLGVASMFVLVISWFAILITGSHPRSLWDFLLGVSRWSARVNIYSAHMTDEYPPFSLDELPEYPVRITADYPEKSNRLTVFFRAILIIPQLIVTGILSYILWIVMFFNIVVVIFTGKPHSELFNFMIAINRWTVRVNLYSQLITDRYPPFSLE